MIVPCQPRIRRLPDELIRVGTSKEAQGRDKTRRGCGVRGDGSDREGALTCFPSGIKTQEDFQTKFCLRLAFRYLERVASDSGFFA